MQITQLIVLNHRKVYFSTNRCEEHQYIIEDT